MTIAPPRPAATGAPEPALDTTALRKQANALRWAAAFFLVPMAIVIALAVAEHQLWGPLVRDGRRAPAEVVAASHWRSSDRLRVAFATPDGKLVEASVPVGDLTRYALGSTVEVAYDPANPRRVRTVQDWDPPYVIPAAVGACLGLLGLAFAWRAWRWPRRLLQVAERNKVGRPMVLASVTVQGRAPVPWAVLWDRDAPPSARPVLAFRLADADDAPDGAIDVEVVAERRRKAVGFVRTPARVMWPAGKIRPVPRSVRRAVEKAEEALAKAEVGPRIEPAGAAGVAMAEMRGDMPPLPPDFFEASRRKARVSPKVLLVFIPVLFGMASPLVLSEVVEAHRQICPKPPPPAAGEANALPAGALASSLPTSLPGYTPGEERVRTIASFANPATVTALVGGGFLWGYERNFVAGTTTVKVQVFQFDSDLGPVLYESKRLASQCAFKPRHLALPAGKGVSGVILEAGERPLHKMTFVRGSRDYIVNMEGFDVSGEADVLARVLETAR